MSQNRQGARYRLNAEQDYQVDRQAEPEVAAIRARLDKLAGRQWDALIALQREQLDPLQQIEMLSRDLHATFRRD